ncbi:MAG: hypothetical protein ACRCZM_07080 [Bacteroidales bacterium]
MNKIFITLSLAAVVATLSLTCPEKSAHSEELTKGVNRFFDRGIRSIADKNIIDNSTLNKASSFVEYMFGSKIVTTVINNNITVDNYILFNIGSMEWKGESKNVSIGILNKVYPLINEKTFEEIERWNLIK